MTITMTGASAGIGLPVEKQCRTDRLARRLVGNPLCLPSTSKHIDKLASWGQLRDCHSRPAIGIALSNTSSKNRDAR